MATKPLLKELIKDYLREAWWCNYGRSLENARVPAKPTSLLSICKGIICRSPFAEHMVQNLPKEKEYLEDFMYYSDELEVDTPE